MNCDWLKDAAAFNCVPVRGINGEAGIEIGTPFSYADGTAIVFYALEHGDHVLLSDNGDMLSHLSSVGINVSGNRMAHLKEKLAAHNFFMGDGLDVRAVFPKAQSAHMLASGISAMLSIAEWEHEHLALSERNRNIVEEAEILLRQWKPGCAIEKSPKIKGQSKNKYSFNYLIDGEYIDIIVPNHTATGAVMRKAGDIKNSPYLNGREIRIVIFDADEPERAEAERQIIGSLAKAMLYSQLERLAIHRTAH
ncbi:DUF1828 domain-containing protein [Eoetvoesiella caeni]|uniref:Uncharacterized protein DUF1828 n=1 Tax=Eoetvoesiella caeni TaxID=645616 RepID=A0A366HAN9_9BURK|nr:DUF1828 domain-containing protein [Eoetvoesiella caeni]MCI2809356.1 DUF1828 domain-containing protein [Eoetvoesiella caeni]NYT54497.1 DUF1828 domain-containing protein [Eoetvoesiella caeni]RBP39314.1 uncharacterized protein DUF1828 [Eoetvoesiella caeni]